MAKDNDATSIRVAVAAFGPTVAFRFRSIVYDVYYMYAEMAKWNVHYMFGKRFKRKSG